MLCRMLVMGGLAVGDQCLDMFMSCTYGGC